MFARRPELAAGILSASGLLGCAESSGTLGRLAPVWAAETAVEASGPVTASLVAMGLAAEVCVIEEQAKAKGQAFDWELWSKANELPASDLLTDALTATLSQDGEVTGFDGRPRIQTLETFDDGDLEVLISPVRVLDRGQACLRLAATHESGALAATLTFLEDGCTGDFATVTAEIPTPCTATEAFVSATAIWNDPQGTEHTVTVPPEGTDSFGLRFSSANPYLPCQGSAAWSGVTDGLRRTFVTTEAYRMHGLEAPVDDDCPAAGTDAGSYEPGDPTTLPFKEWEGVATAPTWSEQACVTVAP